MITLADCFPQSQKPPKLKLGMVLSYGDYKSPYLISAIRVDQGSSGIQCINLISLGGTSVWNTNLDGVRQCLDDVEISHKQIEPALGYQAKSLSCWKIWTKEDVSEWFLKNYPATH